jgi:pyridoxamine 5'-phosphate oxidase
MNPIIRFTEWHKAETEKTKLRLPAACCLSTIGIDGFPNARFVSLKEIKEGNFVITGPLQSRKGLEIEKNSQVALTFWWTGTERQVRIQGNATKISDEQADQYFKSRNQASKIVSLTSYQGEPIDQLSKLEKEYELNFSKFKNKPIPRPKKWGGFSIDPIRIEFMEFKDTRFHKRQLYTQVESEWKVTNLQP